MNPFKLLAVAAVSSALLTFPALAANHAVAIQGFAFSPASLTVAAGDTITFTNMDSAPHTATANDGSFDTGRLGQGDSATVTINAAGTYDYICEIHPRMKGTVTAR